MTPDTIDTITQQHITLLLLGLATCPRLLLVANLAIISSLSSLHWCGVSIFCIFMPPL